MNFVYDSRIRYQDVVSHRLLTSAPVKITLTVLLLAALLGWLSLLFFVSTNIMYGLAFLLTSLAGANLLIFTFGATYFKYLPPSKTLVDISQSKTDQFNIADAATFELISALGRHGRQPNKKHLDRGLRRLIKSKYSRFITRRLEIDRQKLIAAFETVLPDLTWPDFSAGIVKTASLVPHRYLTPDHALGAIMLHPAMQAVIRSIDLTDKDITFAVWWGIEQRFGQQQKRRWWDASRLLSFSGVGLSWASGYTPFVDKFARLPPGNIWDDQLLGHETKVDELINTLARQRQSNVLLVGDPGVGRIGIIRELYRRVKFNYAHPDLNGHRLLYINLGELMAQGGTSAGQYSFVSQALHEMERAGNIIAVIDGLSSILGRNKEQRVNLTDILSPFLSSAAVRVVVITSTEEYHLRLKTNQELNHYFEVVMLPSLDPDATLQRLALTVPGIEKQSRLTIPYKTIRALVRGTTSILPQIPFPERAFDFLEEAIVAAQQEKTAVLTPTHIQTLISRKTGINLGELASSEKARLLNLEDIMHLRMVNQNHAIRAVVKALVRARAEVRSPKRPIGAFLFLGPTGVGKTETAKTLAEAYFGSEDHMVRLDMSEFQGPDAVSSLIGSADRPVGRLTSLIGDHPYTVLLLDEFEKASPQVHQLFLQVFDEGRLTDAAGRNYSFLHSIIIATSNAGAEFIRRAIKDGQVPDGFDAQLKDLILSKNLLRPELLNRFDDVITYSPLTPEHITAIARLMLRSLNKRLDARHGITVKITDELVEFLVSIGYNPEFGARPMNRAIQDTIEYSVAQQIISGLTTPGQAIILPPASLEPLAKK